MVRARGSDEQIRIAGAHAISQSALLPKLGEIWQWFNAFKVYKGERNVHIYNKWFIHSSFISYHDLYYSKTHFR